MLIFHIHDLYKTYCRPSSHPSPCQTIFHQRKIAEWINEWNMNENVFKMGLSLYKR